MQQILAELQLADEAWEGAQAASDNAPPDPGFPHRVRALAEACERQAKSLGDAAWTEGFAWTPLPDRRHMILSHELRRGANRPGPANLWDEFDRAVQRLGIAMEGSVMYVVAFQYRDLAVVMHKIADLLLGEAPDAGGRRERALERGPKAGPQFAESRGWVCGPLATAVRPATTGISDSPGALCGS